MEKYDIYFIYSYRFYFADDNCVYDNFPLDKNG